MTTRVAQLTPAGTGAIATLAVVGPRAWAVVRGRFRPAGGKPLPEAPSLHQFWFGTLGDGAGDEVVVAVKQVEPEPRVEVHCHGGRQVVRWLTDQLVKDGCVEARWQELLELAGPFDARAVEPLTRAPTVRTASILLDQYHGAFTRAVVSILATLDRGDVAGATAGLVELHQHGSVGRHHVEPWKVVIAGPPNVGKSSLINALAGYQRSVVSPVAGTTRDIVTTVVALDGWPVELTDTAGLRATADELEAEGVERARRAFADADFVVWVMDATDPNPVRPGPADGSPLLILNKTDLPTACALSEGETPLPVSATTGAGIAELAAAIVRSLVPEPPAPGAAVPFTPWLADQMELAVTAAASGKIDTVRTILSPCLPQTS
ncbi:GTPase [Fimbriiglobus ruber]|uniref:GTPase and tRNA-U34 5-formylation enzyme TrmE n=1 Tax=Fimbriiglobus ruber TaxID=1908690 RepID=A0A225DGZ6_9BACT|nr:GTPase [Fimbriiglobus ruber]OWK36646.1 GTPase and tRNA-U34 5-formylation enzyme TrmE [Fimbriiglobus ruber]